jgi:hypothetical protein
MGAGALQGAADGVYERGRGDELWTCCGGAKGMGGEKTEERVGDAGAVHVCLVEGIAQS